MLGETAKLIVDLELKGNFAPEVGKASKELSKFDTLFGKVKTSVKQGFGVGVGAAITAKGFQLLDQAASAALGVLGDMTEAAIADEESMSRLGTSLKANIPAWNGNTDAIERTIKARTGLGFSDDEQRESLSRLVAATHDVNRALEIERTAMDLARFKNISLAEATDALTKVNSGVYRGLKSLGIVLKDNATQTEALAAVQAIATGQAEAYTETVRGKMLKAQVAVDEAMENFGRTTLPVVAEGLSVVTFALDRTLVPLDRLEEAAKKGSQGAQAQFALLQHAADELGISLERAWEMSSEAGTLSVDVLRTNMQEAADVLDRGERSVRAASDELGQGIADGIQAGADEAVAIAARTPGDLADALREGRNDWQTELSQFQSDFSDALSPMAETAQIEGILAGKELAQGLASADPIVRAEADELVRKLRERLAVLAGQANEEGRRAGAAAARGLISGFGSPVLKARLRVAKNLNDAEFLASGGPARANSPYIVGEDGPELFVPNTNGRVVPNDKLGSRSGLSSGAQNIHVTVRPSIRDTNTAQDIRGRWGRTPTQVGAA